jgi:hypothetical protein
METGGIHCPGGYYIREGWTQTPQYIIIPDKGVYQVWERPHTPEQETHTQPLFTITGDYNDYVTNTELKTVMENNKHLYPTLLHLKRVLRDMGAQESRTATNRGMTGIKILRKK